MTGVRRVSVRRLEAAISTLIDLAGEEHEVLGPQTRDQLGLVIQALDEILETRR